MARLLVAFICSVYTAQAAIVTPHDGKQSIHSKMEELDRFAKSKGWLNKKDPVHIPAKVKAAVAKARAEQGVVTSVPMVEFGGCGKKIPASKLGLKIAAFPPSLLETSFTVDQPASQPASQTPVRQALPGAGASQVVADNGRDTIGSVNGQEPFVRVLRDGYFEVGCYHDAMAEHGDKYGNNKDKYGSVAKHANVSIANYKDLVLEMEHKEMTPKICFEFCRTLPSMGFFGIINGNECYCEPYFSPQAVDDSRCDVGCQGNPTMMCGNAKGKSTIWEMHLCADTEEDLAEKSAEAEEILTYYYELSGLAYMLGSQITGAGQALQSLAGLSGSPDMSHLGQEAKNAAGDLTKAFISGRPQYERLYDAAMTARSLEGADFTLASKSTEAEHAILTFKDTQGDLLNEAKKISEMLRLFYPNVDASFGDEPAEHDGIAQALSKRTADTPNNYRGAAYAKGATDMEPQASTCSGKMTGKPMVGLGLTGCRLACEQTLYPEKCVAIGHYQVQAYDDLCFMFSDVTDIETFEAPTNPSFLQKKTTAKEESTKTSCDDGVLVIVDAADCPSDCDIATCDTVAPGELCEGDGECGTDNNLDQCCDVYDIYRKEDSGVKARATCEVKMSEISTGYKPKGEFKKNARCFGECEVLDSNDETITFDLPTGLLIRGDASGSNREPMLEKLP